MLTYFCLYSILGYFLESSYISLIKRKIISSGLLEGPYIPLYGIGACILILFYPILSQSYLYTFLIGALLLTILECLASLFIEYNFHTKCWDYSNHYLNYNGKICIFYSFIWGVLSVIFVFYLHPLIINKTNMITELLSIVMICLIFKDLIKRIVNS